MGIPARSRKRQSAACEAEIAGAVAGSDCQQIAAISRSYGLRYSSPSCSAFWRAKRSSNSSSCTLAGSAEQRVFRPPLSEQLPTPHILQDAHRPSGSEGRGSWPASAPTAWRVLFRLLPDGPSRRQARWTKVTGTSPSRTSGAVADALRWLVSVDTHP
jgi:hypothetical protein